MAVVGRIARTHGHRGQVIVNPETDAPESRFRVGSMLYLKGVEGPTPITVTAMRIQAGRPVIGLAGVDSMTEAERLAGAELRIPDAELAPLAAGTFYRHDLVGCDVVTEQGRVVGRVTGVEGPIASRYLVVGEGAGEVLVPLAEAICREIDVRRRRITISPPEGLLDVNAKGRGTSDV
jgi:16S rRNA processing protein RimM